MAEWTKKEIEELLAEMTKKAMTDMEFRKEVLEDATAALEKLAGRALPKGVTLKCIERDPSYQSTFVLPDIVDEEKMDDERLAQVAGGISLVGIVSFCTVAFGAGPDFIACFYKACAADIGLVSLEKTDSKCYGQACAVRTSDENDHCHGHACAVLSSGESDCPARACLYFRG